MINESIVDSFAEANAIAKDTARFEKVSVKIIRHGNSFKVIAPANFDLTPYLSLDGRVKIRESLLSLARNEIDSYKRIIEQEKIKSSEFQISNKNSIVELQDLLLQKDKRCIELSKNLDELSKLFDTYKSSVAKFFNDLTSSKFVQFCNECKSTGFFLKKCLVCSGKAVKQERKKNFDLCTACNGTGGNDGGCWRCAGTGYGEDILVYSPCGSCGGTGNTHQICDVCEGIGMFGDEQFIKYLKEFINAIQYK
jgi:hypothetical protein